MAALARTDVLPAEQPRQRRVPWSSPGRFVFDDTIEHRCRTVDVSTSGMALLAPAGGKIGQKIVCYLDDLGRFEGRIVRAFEGGFAIEINASAAKREQLAQQLAWHGDRPAAQRSVVDAHPDERLTIAKARAVLRLPDARRVGVKIIDLSLSGAAVICPIPITIGTSVRLGDRAAHVTRVARTVVGLSFDAPLRSPQDAAGL